MKCFNCDQEYVQEDNESRVCPECLHAFDEMKVIRKAIKTLEKYGNLDKYGKERIHHHRIYTCFSNAVKEQFSLTLKKFIKNFSLYERSEEFIPGTNKEEMKKVEMRCF
ncbi:MAG: hypothetical protein ACFE9S_15635 [Candidatus Hermodarchaeota archaeon]